MSQDASEADEISDFFLLRYVNNSSNESEQSFISPIARPASSNTPNTHEVVQNSLLAQKKT
ncbi:hypothetical protein DASC09_054840 [Saccharomycopsis crataegensis]|uniref:Uncharacterized protein n=1 Tax=Saccharomycopsis crataegensis TaxID=43959 RepID=A0AAV5QU77_9ASCO|nr:hypothetical protein DASC09_028840 [Saccharomycopsis crataegensis]GMM38145.1 hypothetical protein DASC09_054840 [Saccharomycopsis crataegensis]